MIISDARRIARLGKRADVTFLEANVVDGVRFGSHEYVLAKHGLSVDGVVQELRATLAGTTGVA